MHIQIIFRSFIHCQLFYLVFTMHDDDDTVHVPVCTCTCMYMYLYVHVPQKLN